MTKKELKSMMREIAREEVYRVLPELLKEAVTETLTEVLAKPAKKQAPRKRRQPEAPKMTKRSILEQIGYNEYGLQEDHDNDETYHFDTGDRAAIARQAGVPVPMATGLRAHENSMGQGGYSSVDPDLVEAGVAPSPLAANEPIPDFLANAINKAKDIVDRTSEMENFRPGQR